MSVVDDESSLVREAMAGNGEAFSELASRHWRRLLALARSIIADLEAEDVVQDGLVKGWRNIGSLRDPEAFPAWLTRIVANTALSKARRRRILQPLEGFDIASAAGTPDVKIDFARMLSRIPPRQRAVLHLTVVEGLTDREISDLLRISPSSVRVHRLRGRRRLGMLARRSKT